MNVVREILKINDLELREGISGPASWHCQYKDSAWVYVGGLCQEVCTGLVLDLLACVLCDPVTSKVGAVFK